MSITIRERIVIDHQYKIHFYLDFPGGNIFRKEQTQFFVTVLIFKVWSGIVFLFCPASVAKSSLPLFVSVRFNIKNVL
jgi:hypothetical protein